MFIAPNFVSNDKKLTLSDKQAMISSAQLIIKYWEADLPKTMVAVVHKQ